MWATKWVAKPLVYACILALLLGYRVYKWRKHLFRISAVRVGKADAV
jgi:hypothetical protein